MKTINNQAELRNLVCTVIDSAELKFDQGSDYSEPIRKKLTILMTCYAIDWIRFGLDLTDRDGIFTINGEDKNGVDLSFKSPKALFKFIDPFLVLKIRDIYWQKKHYVKSLPRKICMITTSCFTN